MRRVALISVVIVLAIQRFAAGENGEVTLFTPDELEEAISADTIQYDFILLDVRDDSEVKNGIIATRYCKPYHMSWNFDELQQNYLLLPTEFTLVASITGGISQYPGELADSIEFKPWTKLPEPSYFSAAETRLAGRKAVQPRINSSPAGYRHLVTLQGREVKWRPGFRYPPVFIVERTGNESAGRIEGFHLVHETGW
jgi:hypothetical protein